MCVDSPRQLEEERRLFYVAITRAEEDCFLSCAKSRFRYGKTEFSTPSRFLRDIDAKYLTLPSELQISSAYGGRSAQGGSYRDAQSPRPVRQSFSRMYESSKPEFVRPSAPAHLKRVSSASVSLSENAPSVAGLQV